jgi:hypothetical protein
MKGDWPVCKERVSGLPGPLPRRLVDAVQSVGVDYDELCLLIIKLQRGNNRIQFSLFT